MPGLSGYFEIGWKSRDLAKIPSLVGNDHDDAHIVTKFQKNRSYSETKNSCFVEFGLPSKPVGMSRLMGIQKKS